MSQPSKPKKVLTNDAAALQRATSGYPHVVVRLIPSVYARASVEFVSDPLAVGLADGFRTLRILDPEPEAGQELTPNRLSALRNGVAEVCDASGFKMCLVVAENEVYYCTPHGVPFRGTKQPSGGISLYGEKEKREEAESGSADTPDMMPN